VLVKFLPAQEMSDATTRCPPVRNDDQVLRLQPASAVVCPDCGARIGKTCVSTVPALGFGMVGAPIEGVHAERVAAAREQGIT
jgi:hypothetical protein